MVWLGPGWIRTRNLPHSERTLYYYATESVIKVGYYICLINLFKWKKRYSYFKTLNPSILKRPSKNILKILGFDLDINVLNFCFLLKAENLFIYKLILKAFISYLSIFKPNVTLKGVYLSIFLSFYPSIHLSIYPSFHLSIYLSIYLSTL